MIFQQNFQKHLSAKNSTEFKECYNLSHKLHLSNLRPSMYVIIAKDHMLVKAGVYSH